MSGERAQGPQWVGANRGDTHWPQGEDGTHKNVYVLGTPAPYPSGAELKTVSHATATPSPPTPPSHTDAARIYFSAGTSSTRAPAPARVTKQVALTPPLAAG